MSNKDSFLSKSQKNLLKQFKKQISPANTSTVVPVQEKTPKEEEQIDDTTLFQSALQGVQRLDHSNVVQRTKPTKPKKPDAQTIAKRIAAEGMIEHDALSTLSDTQAALNPVGSQQSLSYRIATLQNKVFEDLKTGKMRWFEAVDLHGCTVEQARAAVLEIMHIAQQNNQNVIKIVHGKGPDAVLKTYVNGWLRQHREVLAFVSAPENQGGTGAVLVLLKRAEKNPKYQP